MMITMEIKIKECPHCGGNAGFQVSQSCRGSYDTLKKFNGEEFLGGYSDSMQYGKNKTPFCINCRKPLGRWIKLGDE